jgi:hypothetical protein
MKPLMILGALVGFLIGTACGFTGRSEWPTALWRASVAALAAAILTRWWTRVWIQGLHESLNQRRNADPVLPPAKPNGKS